jgi:hypothetical protein
VGVSLFCSPIRTITIEPKAADRVERHSLNLKSMIRQMAASFFYPAEPALMSYEAILKTLNRRRSRLGLARIEEYKSPERPFRPQPYVVVSTCQTESSTTTYDYEPPDDFGAEEPHGYRP